jgi:hypothetical protein
LLHPAQEARAGLLGADFPVEVGVQPGVADEIAARGSILEQVVFEFPHPGFIQQPAQVVVDQAL